MPAGLDGARIYKYGLVYIDPEAEHRLSTIVIAAPGPRPIDPISFTRGSQDA